MHGVAGLDDAADFLGVAVDQGHFAGVSQGDREHVLEVVVVHLLGRPILDRHDDLPGIHRVLEAVLGRHIRRHLDVLGHQGDFVLGQDVVEIHHAAVGTVADDLFQTRLTELDRSAFGLAAVLGGAAPVRLEVLAGSALAQHTMTAGAALEVDLLRGLLFGGGQRRGSLLREGTAHGAGHGRNSKKSE